MKKSDLRSREKEYKKIFFDYSYYDACKYLQKKYGLTNKPYMIINKNGNLSKVKNLGRGREGLFLHHIKEDSVIMLCNIDCNIAYKYPLEFHAPKNLCYCDYFEHMILHWKLTLMYKNKRPLWEVDGKVIGMGIGIGGLVNFLLPEINFMYFKHRILKQKETLPWRQACWKTLEPFFDLYIEFLKEIHKSLKKGDFTTIEPKWEDKMFSYKDSQLVLHHWKELQKIVTKNLKGE